MFNTYILYSKAINKFYIGFTGEEVQFRLAKHLVKPSRFYVKIKICLKNMLINKYLKLINIIINRNIFKKIKKTILNNLFSAIYIVKIFKLILNISSHLL